MADDNAKIAVLRQLIDTSLRYTNKELMFLLVGYTLAALPKLLLSPQSRRLSEMVNPLVENICQGIFSREAVVELFVEMIDQMRRPHVAALAAEAYVERYMQQQMELMVGLANDSNHIVDLWNEDNLRQQHEKMNQLEVERIMGEENDWVSAKKEQAYQDASRSRMQMECQICADDIDMHDLSDLRCGHNFHKACIYQAIEARLKDNALIKCPSEECAGRELSNQEVTLHIDGPLLEKYEKFTFNKFVESNSQEMSWCPTAGCEAVFEFDDLLTNYRCPACKKHYCLKCRVDFHIGMTCAEYRVNNEFSDNDRKFVDFVKGTKFKQCPKCKYWVERNDGCSTMSCRCGQKFCYDCGGVGCPHGRCSGSGEK